MADTANTSDAEDKGKKPLVVVLIGSLATLLLAVAAVLGTPGFVAWINQRHSPVITSTTSPLPSSGQPDTPPAKLPPAPVPSPVQTPAIQAPEPRPVTQSFNINGYWSGTTDTNHIHLVLHLNTDNDNQISGTFTNLECATGGPELTLPLDTNSSWSGKRLVAHMTYMGKVASIAAIVSDDALSGTYTEFGVDTVEFQRGKKLCQ